MALTVAELTATLGLDIRDLKAGSVSAQREFADLRKSASGTGAGFDDLKKAAKGSTDSLADLKVGAKGGGEAMGGLRVAAQNVSGVMAQAGVNTGILGAAVGALSSPFGIAAAGAVILGLAIKSTTDFMVTNYDQMRRLIAVSGLEAEAADQLSDTFDLLGLNSEALTTSLFRMSAEVDSGGKQLKEIGVDLRAVGGELKTEGALFLEARDKISAMTSASERNAAAQRIFGRGAREMAEVFAMNTTEFNKWLETAGKMGPSAEESMRVTREYTRALALFTKQLNDMVEVVGQKVLPQLTSLLQIMSSIAGVAVKPIEISVNIVWNLFGSPITSRAAFMDQIRDLFTGAQPIIGAAMRDSIRAGLNLSPMPTAFRDEPEMDTLGSGMFEKSSAERIQLMKAEVEQQKLLLKEVESERLRSIAIVQANMQAAIQLNQMSESEAAQQSIHLAEQTFAAKAAAINGEIALIRRTSSEAIRDGTEAGDKIRALIVQRKDAHAVMQVAVIGFEAAMTKAALDGQREVAAGSIETLKARLSSSAALLKIQQESAVDIVGVQGSDVAAFTARLTAETQAKIDAAEAQTKTSADYAAAVEAIMAAHYSKLGVFLREALERDIAAMPEALGELGRSIALIGDATEEDITPMEKAWEDLRLQMEDVNRSSAALGGRFDATSALIQIQEQRVRLLAAEYGPLSEKVRAAVGELDRLKGTQFTESLAGIQREAALVGRDFDLAGANLGKFKDRILELQAIPNPTGEILSELDQLKAKFADTRDFIQWRDAFNSVFSSIGSAINTSVQGVIMGTQTMAQAWDNLWRSIVLSFINSGIQRLLTGLQNQLWDFISGLFGGSSSGAGAGNLISGAIGFIGKLFSGSSTSASVAAFDQSIDTLGLGVSTAGKGLDLFAGSLGKTLGVLGGVAALGTSIFALVGSAQSGNTMGTALGAGGTVLSAYSLASTISTALGSTLLPSLSSLVAKALVAVAPQFVTAINTALGTSIGVATGAASGTAAASSIGASITAGLANAFAWMANPATVFAGMFLAGGFAGMEADAEETSQVLREIRGSLLAVSSAMGLVAIRFGDLSTALDAAHLPKTLAELQSALDSLPDLALAVGVGAAGITAAAAEWKAKFGVTLLAALDAAHAQGIDGGQFVSDRNRRLADPMVGGVPAGEQDRTLAVLQDTDLFRRWAQSLRSIDKIITVQQHFLDSLEMDANGMATGSRGGGALPDWLVGGPQNTQLIDVMKMNAQLDREHLTIALRNAVVDVGAMLGLSAGQFTGLTPAGSEADWQATGGGLGRTDPLPSVAAIAQVQAALTAAGFEPGNYGKALTAYLLSVDANVVNHPQWAKFTDALQNATTSDAVDAAIRGLRPPLSPVEFYDAAKSVTDSINAEMKALLLHRAELVAVGADLGEVDKILEGMASTVKAYAALVQLFVTIPQEIAGILMDAAGQTQAAIDAWLVTRKSLDDSVTMAQTAFTEALDTGNIVAIQQTGQALHDAAMGRLQALLDMTRQLEAATQKTREAMSTLAEMATAVSQWEISSRGDASTLTSLLDSLSTMATTADTVAARLWAVNAGLAAIIATLSTAVAKFGSMQTGEDWLRTGTQTADQLQASGPSQITDALIGGARPFLAAQQDAIDAAEGPAKFAMLQQQAASIVALQNAAVAAVTQWANQAIEGAREAAATVLKGLAEARDAAMAALVLERDAKLAAIDLEIAGIQEAATLAHEARVAQIEGLREAEQAAQAMRRAEIEAMSAQVAKAEELEAAVEGMGKFLAELQQGPLGPGNPADKLMQAQDSFARALQTYTAAPTAAGLTDLQGLAQSVLSLAEPIFSKPSPQFQALSATTIKQLEAAQALAAAQVTDSQVLRSQLDMLIAMDQAASEGAASQIAALEKLDTTASKVAADLIAKLQEDKVSISKDFEAASDKITKDFETQTAAIEAALALQELAIQAAADKEITEINNAAAAALKINFEAQALLIKEQLAHEKALADAIPDTKQFQTDTVAILRDIAANIALAVGAPPAASGIENVTEGLYHLHDREAVLPASLADDWRAGRGRFGIRSAELGAGLPVRPEMPWENAPDKTRTPGFLMSPGDYYYQQMNDAGRIAAMDQVAKELAALPGWDPHGMNGSQAPWVWGPGTVPGTSRPPTAPPFVPPGPGWLHRTGKTAGSGDGVSVTLVIEKGAIGPITGSADPEKTADLVEKKLVDRIERGDLGVKILKRAGLT